MHMMGCTSAELVPQRLCAALWEGGLLAEAAINLLVLHSLG